MTIRQPSITFIMPFGHPLLIDPPEPGAGGAERQFYLFGMALKKEGWEVNFICHIENKKAKSKCNVIHASFSYLGGSKFRMIFDWLSLITAMSKAKSDFYVVKTPGHLLVPMSVFSKIARKKIVFWAQTEHDAYPNKRTIKKLPSILQDYGVGWTDILIAQNKSQVKGFKENYDKNAYLVKSLVGGFNEEINKPKMQTKDNDILWVGNSSENKRFELVISLAKSMPKMSFAVAMIKQDHMRYELARSLCSELGNVTFLGEVAPNDIEIWFKRSKLFINTSIREGFPNTFLQSWQVGIPVISLCVDPDNVITKYKLGYKVMNDNNNDAYDESSLTELLLPYIENLLSKPTLLAQVSNNAINYIDMNHIDKPVKNLVSCLLENY
jgi:glycosyltransferase involved in cell wall biosynthesis